MKASLNWKDSFTDTKDRVIYTYSQHRIPGVSALAHHSITSAIPSLEWHYHENSFEFSMAAQGAFTFSTETASYKFSGGDVMVNFPNEVHGTNHLPVTTGDLYWFQLTVSDENQFLFLNPQAARSLIAQLMKIPHHIVQTDADQTLPLLKSAFKLIRRGGNPQMAATYLQLFLHLLISFSSEEQFRLSPDIGRTLNYIMDHITEALTLDELASVANLSCSQYKQKFKKQMGISPRYYINQQKIEYSKMLLQDGMSVTDIAMLLNFNTSSYFSTVFKKYTLFSPLEYLKTLEH